MSVSISSSSVKPTRKGFVVLYLFIRTVMEVPMW
jgi:hypothetical protein